MRRMIEKARVHVGVALIGLGFLIAPDSYFRALIKAIKEESSKGAKHAAISV